MNRFILTSYVDSLQYWICANRDWSLTAMRYALPRGMQGAQMADAWL
jgi:hypothetical protein